MTTLTITLDDKLASQIREAAKARGTEADKVAVEVLKRAFGEATQDASDAPEQSVETSPTAEQFLAFLAPVWAETRSLSGKSSLPEDEAGEIFEAKLAQYYAEDYDRAQRRKP